MAEVGERPGSDIEHSRAVTFSVISGALTSTVRQMTVNMERTSRSPIFNLGHDYSNALFDSGPDMIVQGEDLPIHLGSLMYATKEVAAYFGEDIAPGDVFYHNDPTTGGSHLQDMSMMKPVFIGDELLFWVSTKGHMEDTGGAIAGGYDPEAQDLHAEGLRLPPLKLYDSGKQRRDVMNLVVSNVRPSAQLRNNMAAQLATLEVGERNLIALVRRYGVELVREAVAHNLALSDQHMRTAIDAIPDGSYAGIAPVEDDGRSGEATIECVITVEGSSMHVALSSRPQTRSYINSYWANTLSSVFYGVLLFTRIPPPYNEGLYRALSVDLGAEGTLTNAQHPAACAAATTTVGDNITDAVVAALSQAVPERTNAGWCHVGGTNQLGISPVTDEPYTFNMSIATSGGAGASWGYDGWHAIGARCLGGACMSGDVELLETEYPIRIHRYELREDSGGPGAWRGGLGIVFEVQPLDHDVTLILWGEGRKYPAESFGSKSLATAPRVTRKFLVDDREWRELPWPARVELEAHQRFVSCTGGGGGVGDPFTRALALVESDVRNELVSHEAARIEYGVIVDSEGGYVVEEATRQCRSAKEA